MKNHDPLDIRGQEIAIADRELRDKLARENEEADVKWLMSNKRGRRVMWRLLEQSGVYRLSFNSNSMTMAFNEGQRNFGNRTLALIHTHCSELYPVMLKEATQNVRNADDGPSRNDH